MGVEFYLACLETKEHIHLGKYIWREPHGFQIPDSVICKFLFDRTGLTFRFDTDGDLERLDDEGSVEIDNWVNHCKDA